MKYVYILIGVIILVRIDMLLLGIETLISKMRKSTQPTSPITTSSTQSDDLIPLKEDRSIVQTPRSVFFSLLDEFHTNPVKEIRDKMVEVLRMNPAVLAPKLDESFEGEIYKFRDLVYNENEELPYLLVELIGLLQGENLEMVKRFMTIMLDRNVEGFLRAYSRSSDTNCMIAKLVSQRLTDEEALNEYLQREAALEEFSNDEKRDPALRNLARNCLAVVRMQINKMTSPSVSEGEREQSIQP